MDIREIFIFFGDNMEAFAKGVHVANFEKIIETQRNNENLTTIWSSKFFNLGTGLNDRNQHLVQRIKITKTVVSLAYL